MDDPVTGSWWRRNALALVALSLLVPASVYAIDTIEFGATRDPSRGVASGETTQVGDWTFGPATVTGLDPATVGAPSATSPVLVTVPVTPGDAAVGCGAPTIVDPADGREWRTDFLLAQPLELGQQTSCASDGAVGFDLVHTVLLTGDIDGDLVVVLPAHDGGNGVDLRFTVSGALGR